MKTISVTLSDELLENSRYCADALSLSMAAYIRRAVERMNRETKAQLRAKRIAEASKRVRKESMRVNAEFAESAVDPIAAATGLLKGKFSLTNDLLREQRSRRSK